MKKYKLLKDLPFAKKGEIYESRVLDDGEEYLFFGEIKVKDIDNFDEWFEEVKEPKKFFRVDAFMSRVGIVNPTCHLEWEINNLKSLGMLFETEQEAEEYLAYLKAKEVIRQDTKGFKPDWNNPSQKKIFGYYNLIDKTLCYFDIGENMESKIFFKSEEDIKESFKKHAKEWRTYLTYGQ